MSNEEKEAEERRVKRLTLGNIRLIGELYKGGVVREPVVHVCIGELLGSASEKPIDDNIEVRASV